MAVSEGQGVSVCCGLWYSPELIRYSGNLNLAVVEIWKYLLLPTDNTAIPYSYIIHYKLSFHVCLA